jgi:nucleoside-diphosphate-sugar epimerase
MAFNNRRDFPSDSLTNSEVIWVQTGTSGIFLLKEGTAPSTIANYAQIYAKSSDHLLYWKDSSGLERIVGSGSSMVYPGTGIPLSTGAGWDTSITDNSANWNIAYGWGNHASAGYLTAASSLDPSKITQSLTYRFVTDAQISAWNVSSSGISAELAIAFAIAL